MLRFAPHLNVPALAAKPPAGATQTIVVPVSGPVDTFAIQYTNDAFTATEDRNVFLSSVVLNGDANRKGFNAGFDVHYDYKAAQVQYSTVQVTYNTDCCGISVQYRRFNFGSRFENQFRVAFAVANIGTFGTLKKQERMF